MYTYSIIIASDKAYSGERPDLCIDTIKKIVGDKLELVSAKVLPDEQNMLEDEMKKLAHDMKVDLILTSGGTGFSKRDITVEATENVVNRLTPGISEAIRYHSLAITPKAMLSRGTSGICGETLIVNLPGSPKSIREILDYILVPVIHGIDVIKGDAFECGKENK